MSLATRCTHCGTIFKVVQDQLKVSEGWVRCGRCDEVFNAMPALFDLDTESPPPRVLPQPPATVPHSAPAPEPAPPPAPPNDWAQTRPDPLGTPVSTPFVESGAGVATHAATVDANGIESDLPLPEAPVAAAAATEFDLDTAVDVEPALDAPLSLDIRGTPSPWLDELPAEPADLPSTDEADALDSRYLLPSIRESKVPRRRGRGPEFADAEFPSDAMLDAEEAWASDFGNLPIEPEPAPVAPAKFAPPAPAPMPATPSAPALAKTSAPDSQPDDDDSIPTTQPSRFGENYVPELPVEPPSLRKGRPGTRGRDPAQQTPEFVKRAQRQAMWRHPAVRGLLSVIALGLSLGLALQMAHQFRDLLAAYYPDARPVLAQWCELAGCQIRPPLKLESLQVESATLVRASSEGPDNYRLAVVVRNRAAVDLAWPHVDLTLTDENGAIIARKVFSAADAQWLDTAEPKADAPAAAARPSASAPVPSAAPRQRSTTLQWRLRANDLRPAGYTAELFYP